MNWLVNAIVFEPALTLTARVGAVALLPVLIRRRNMRVAAAVVVLLPVSPILLVRLACSLVIDLCDRLADAIPGTHARLWAAHVIAGANPPPLPENVVAFNPRKGGSRR